MTKEISVPVPVPVSTPAPAPAPQKPKLEPVREYTQHDLDIAKQKNELGYYRRFAVPLENQLKDKTGRQDLNIDDFITFAMQNTYFINLQALNISRSWNNKFDIELRLGLRQPKKSSQEPATPTVLNVASVPVPVMADLKPVIPVPPVALRVPKTLSVPDFKAPQDNFNAFILAEQKKNILNEAEIIEALLTQAYTLDELKPYFKSLN